MSEWLTSGWDALDGKVVSISTRPGHNQHLPSFDCAFGAFRVRGCSRVHCQVLLDEKVPGYQSLQAPGRGMNAALVSYCCDLYCYQLS